MALLEQLPETAQRWRHELALQSCISTVVTATHGRASLVLEQSLQRAQALCQALDVTAERVPLLVRLLASPWCAPTGFPSSMRRCG